MTFSKKVTVAKTMAFVAGIAAFLGLGIASAAGAFGSTLPTLVADFEPAPNYQFLVPIAVGMMAFALAATAIGQSWVAAKAVTAVGRNPEAADQIKNTMIVGAALAETGGLYALVVAILVMVMF